MKRKMLNILIEASLSEKLEKIESNLQINKSTIINFLLKSAIPELEKIKNS